MVNYRITFDRAVPSGLHITAKQQLNTFLKSLGGHVFKSKRHGKNLGLEVMQTKLTQDELEGILKKILPSEYAKKCTIEPLEDNLDNLLYQNEELSQRLQTVERDLEHVTAKYDEQSQLQEMCLLENKDVTAERNQYRDLLEEMVELISDQRGLTPDLAKLKDPQLCFDYLFDLITDKPLSEDEAPLLPQITATMPEVVDKADYIAEDKAIMLLFKVSSKELKDNNEELTAKFRAGLRFGSFAEFENFKPASIENEIHYHQPTLEDYVKGTTEPIRIPHGTARHVIRLYVVHASNPLDTMLFPFGAYTEADAKQKYGFTQTRLDSNTGVRKTGFRQEISLVERLIIEQPNGETVIIYRKEDLDALAKAK